MANLAILGAQWGDEGKGKIVDALSERFDVVVRFQGGSNAGHTVVVDEEKIILHQIPSGIMRPRTTCVIANGVVVDPKELIEEMGLLESKGYALQGRLFISDRSHLVLPSHKLLDNLQEEVRGDGCIGTTGKGIGPSYEFKVSRSGLRVGDTLEITNLEKKVADITAETIRKTGRPKTDLRIDEKKLLDELTRFGARAKPFITDTVNFLHSRTAEGARILFEVAQGAMLDIDFGTYPYVTSSSTTAGGICAGTGLPPGEIHKVLGVTKAYATRVGRGPFPTEEEGKIGDLLRQYGGEYGATTGRPRRCGWFDAVAVRYAARLNGFDALAVTKIDVLDDLEKIKVCPAYQLNGKTINRVPASVVEYSRCRPVFETLPGWREPLAGETEYQSLPEKARNYLDYLSDLVGLPVAMISTGCDRRSLILRKQLLQEFLNL